MKKIYAVVIAIFGASVMASAVPVKSGELFATFQKHGDTFYRGNTTIDTENPDGRDLDINYYIVSCGQTMLFRAENPGEDINFAGDAWAVQLRVYNDEGGQQTEIQACDVVDAHLHYTGADCNLANQFSAKTENLQIHFFLNSNVEGGYRRTETIEFNRASINNPIEDAVAPVINPAEVTMTEEDGKLIFTFGEVTAEDVYFFYVGDKDHHVGGISLTNKVVIEKPTVKDGTTYAFKCCAVDFNGNQSASKEFKLEMEFDPAVDLALNKPCEAGAVQGFNTADKAVNGNPDDFWTSFGEDDGDAWWQVDLGNVYDITEIKIHFNDVWGSYSIYGDRAEFPTKAIVENETADNNSTVTYSDLNVAARYLWVVSTVNQIGIREFNVYGKGVADPETATSMIESGAASKATKVIEAGRLFIIHDGKKYSITGQQCE